MFKAFHDAAGSVYYETMTVHNVELFFNIAQPKYRQNFFIPMIHFTAHLQYLWKPPRRCLPSRQGILRYVQYSRYYGNVIACEVGRNEPNAWTCHPCSEEQKRAHEKRQTDSPFLSIRV